MSMAVGLEVRVPSATTGWQTTYSISLAFEDFRRTGKEYSTCCDTYTVTYSILERQKNPYPSTKDPAYEKALAELPRFWKPIPPRNILVEQEVIERSVARHWEQPAHSERAGLERARSISAW